jgi:hypothetical protein
MRAECITGQADIIAIASPNGRVIGVEARGPRCLPWPGLIAMS